MRRIQKVVAAILAMIMAMAMTVTVFAQEATEDMIPSITISNATKGADYTLYKVFDATVSEGDHKIAYKWPESKTWPGDNNFFEKDNKGNIKALPGAYEENSTEQLSAGAIAWIKENGVKVAEQKNVQTENITFTLAPRAWGYYYVTSSVKADGGVISVTSTQPQATIIDKNQEPSWNKDDKSIVLKPGTNQETKVKVNDSAFGDEVTFEIVVNATNYYKDEKVLEYYIHDELGTGLEYNQNSIVVKVGSKAEALAEGDYTVEWIGTDKLGNPTQSSKFKITIPWMTTGDNAAFKYNANDTITVRYTAKVDKDAVIAAPGNKNTAYFDFKTDKDEPENPDDPKPYHKSEEKTTTTYTYALGIYKTNETGTALAGAEFKIAGLGGVLVDQDKGIYDYTKDTNAQGYVDTFKVGNNGQLIIKGVTSGSYTVTESKAPDGYNLLTQPVTITAQQSSVTTYTTTHTIYYDADGKVVSESTEGGSSATVTFPVNISGITVVNNTGSTLPSTGGIGTTIFYVVGAILVIGAGILLVTKKRMSREI